MKKILQFALFSAVLAAFSLQAQAEKGGEGEGHHEQHNEKEGNERRHKRHHRGGVRHLVKKFREEGCMKLDDKEFGKNETCVDLSKDIAKATAKFVGGHHPEKEGKGDEEKAGKKDEKEKEKEKKDDQK